MADTALTTLLVSATELRATVPSGLQPGTYAISVANPDNHTAILPNGYTVLDSKTSSIDDLYGNPYEIWTSPATPRVGSAVSLGLIVHRYGGASVLPNIAVRFWYGECNSGTLIGTGTVSLLEPDGMASTAGISWTPASMGSMSLCALIDPDDLIAESREDNNRVSRTLVVLKAGDDLVAPHVDNFMVQKGALLTSSRDIKLDATASDPDPSSGLASVYYQEFEYHQGVKSWIPVQQSGWLSFGTATSDYGWRLVPFIGLHYMQCWAIDKAGNISVQPHGGNINYIPLSDKLANRQKRIYRQTVLEDQTLTVVVTPISGDPDLYVWAPDSLGIPPWVSNLSSGVDQVSFKAPKSGSYQIEVHGSTATQYQLMINVTSTVPNPIGGSAAGKEAPTAPAVPPSSEPDQKTAIPSATLRQNFLPLVLR